MYVNVCVFLEHTFFFHINGFRGEVNLYFFKMLHRTKENNTVSGQNLVFSKTDFYVVQ